MTEYQRINKQNIFIILLLGAVGMIGGSLTPMNLSFQLPAITVNLQNIISPDIGQMLSIIGVIACVVLVASVIYMLMGVAGMSGRMR